MSGALDRIEELAKHATRWTVVVTRNNHRSFYNEEVEAEAVLAMVEVIRAAKESNLNLSRILHEMAGSVSLCWEPKPTGEFHSTLACEFVASAITEIRTPIDAAISKLEQMK